MAGTAVRDWRHASSDNPALLTSAIRPAISLSATRPYSLPGLYSGSFEFVQPTRPAYLSAGIKTTVVPRYQEHDVSLSAATSFACSLAVGVRLQMLAVTGSLQGADAIGALDAGLLWYRGPVAIGASALRVNCPRFRCGDELPLRLLAGFSWRPVPEVLVAVDAERGQEERLLAGMEISLLPALALRLGLTSEPLTYAAGVGIRLARQQADYSCRFHPQLGPTHVLGITMSWD